MTSSGVSWFAVRCLFDTGLDSQDDGQRIYEERITLWRATGFEAAIARAEAEAEVYATEIEDVPGRYLGLAQAYKLFGEPGDGAELFSLMRGSGLLPSDYLDRFFDTGSERQSQQA